MNNFNISPMSTEMEKKHITRPKQYERTKVELLKLLEYEYMTYLNNKILIGLCVITYQLYQSHKLSTNEYFILKDIINENIICPTSTNYPNHIRIQYT